MIEYSIQQIEDTGQFYIRGKGWGITNPITAPKLVTVYALQPIDVFVGRVPRQPFPVGDTEMRASMTKIAAELNLVDKVVAEHLVAYQYDVEARRGEYVSEPYPDSVFSAIMERRMLEI